MKRNVDSFYAITLDHVYKTEEVALPQVLHYTVFSVEFCIFNILQKLGYT